MVRLRHGKIASVMPMPKDFHSTMVRLRRVKGRTTFKGRSYFHSTMVRLRPGMVFSLYFILMLISIPQWFDWDPFFITTITPQNLNFHSTIGSIETKSIQEECLSTGESNFHSTMVRLRLGWIGLGWMGSTSFPFHNGSIETVDYPIQPRAIARFPFHNGSIETWAELSAPGEEEMISIPQWFDWDSGVIGWGVELAFCWFPFHNGLIETQFS